MEVPRGAEDGSSEQTGVMNRVSVRAVSEWSLLSSRAHDTDLFRTAVMPFPWDSHLPFSPPLMLVGLTQLDLLGDERRLVR